MSGDPVADYSQALQERNAATAAIESMVKRVADGANKLGSWESVVVSNIPGASFPEGNLRLTIAGDQWPSGQDIADTLLAYHKAEGAARGAWNRVPESQRGALRPPPGLIGKVHI